jgi:hypothetical protein
MSDVTKGPKLPWGKDVDDAHYDAAYDYLSLHWLPKNAGPAVQALRDAGIERHMPGDVLRAAQVDPRPFDDTRVQQEIVKALNDGEFQPALVINLPEGVVIADGTHRLSAAYHLAPTRKATLKLAPSAKEPFRP